MGKNLIVGLLKLILFLKNLIPVHCSFFLLFKYINFIPHIDNVINILKNTSLDSDTDSDSSDEFNEGIHRPTLVRQIQSILQQYPDDGQILKVSLTGRYNFLDINLTDYLW